MFLILDDVLDQVHDQILIHPPELGGALLGPPDQPIITKFILDEDAINTTTNNKIMLFWFKMNITGI